MARKNLSHPKENLLPMLSKIALAALVLLACLPGQGQTIPPTTITAPMVFYAPNPCPSGELLGFWLFQNGYGDRTSITIWCPGPSNYLPAGSVVWSYDKNNTRAYWNPGVPQAHLDFVLSPNPDGSWYSPASLITFPQSCPWCAGGWTELTADIVSSPTAQAYSIIPAQATSGQLPSVVDTSYWGYGLIGVLTFDSVIGSQTPPETRWRTAASVEVVNVPNIYNGPALVSEQWEGPCFLPDGTYFAAPSCNHERWYFAPAWGLVKVEVLAGGAGDNPDRNLDMYRI